MEHRTEITIETDKLLMINSDVRHAENRSHESQAKPSIWCFSCAEYVKALTTDQAAIQAGVTALTIFRRVESGLIHYIESSDGRLLICPNSL